MSIAKNLSLIQSSLNEKVTLVAVSKTKPNEDIMEAYDAGQRIFGENKVQDMTEKFEALPKDIQWHMIGHLQTNKVKYIAPYVSLIHGVDSFKLLKEINKQAKKNDRTIKCLLQFHIAQESTKFGLSIVEAEEMFSSSEFKLLENVQIVGVMGMASNVSNEEQVSQEFNSLALVYNNLKTSFSSNFKIISMGMSGDYQLAISSGSNMVRVGSAIFGNRN